MAERYILKNGKKVIEEGGLNRRLFEELNNAEVKKAVFLGKEAIYYESLGEKSVMVSVNRKNAGLAKIIAMKLIEKKLVDLSSVDDIFEFAERVKSASLDDLAKLR
uniref:Uncharacterized protein n=1 Tax=Archaeoglobus fulgidus TaxID=2234 RepID=A0A7J2TIE5_ARCFL